MNIDEAVSLVSERFTYKPDSIGIFDSWAVMHERNGHLYGDCDNFALTTIWYACNKSVLTFILYVLILHRYRFWFCLTKDGQKHVVGYAQGKYFDNYAYQALEKKDFFGRTLHKRKFVYPSPLVLLYMAIGIFVR